VKNPYNAYALNNITAKKAADGSVAVQFGGCDGAIPQQIEIAHVRHEHLRGRRPHHHRVPVHVDEPGHRRAPAAVDEHGGTTICRNRIRGNALDRVAAHQDVMPAVEGVDDVTTEENGGQGEN
jgi:hypothetical protein